MTLPDNKKGGERVYSTEQLDAVVDWLDRVDDFVHELKKSALLAKSYLLQSKTLDDVRKEVLSKQKAPATAQPTPKLLSESITPLKVEPPDDLEKIRREILARKAVKK